jgi:REP element-mobilizing transposase RayT
VPRILRTTLPDGCFHITALGVDGVAIFRDDDDRRFYLALLAYVVRAYGWTCFAFCLMTSHTHLLVDAEVDKLSRGVQYLHGVYAQTFNRKYSRTGHLFGARFCSRVVDTDDYFENAVDYVLENPVRAGLCERAEDWPWSAVDERTFAS